MADRFVKEDDPCNLPPSKLGTKKYWDEAYTTELVNFKDSGDVGEIWFGESSIKRMVKWIKNCNKISKSASFLDIGCGNGMLLVHLAKQGYTNLTGVDYSSKAIELATSIAEEEQVNINYLVCDLAQASNSSILGADLRFDVCLDKGTYDAISLNPQDAQGCRAKYINSVSRLLTDDGIFVICSCNWTESELIAQFEAEFEFLEAIPAPTFSFGGQTGNTVTTLVFRVRTL